MSARLCARSGAGALAAFAWIACASRPAPPVIDLTPFAWTFSQISLGALVIRYGFPDEASPATEASDAAAFAEVPVAAGARATRLASHRYDCASPIPARRAPCTVALDFWLLELDPPLEDETVSALRARLEPVSGEPPQPGNDPVRDSHGRQWCHRARVQASGAAFAHYSRPIDARRALVVTSFTTRAPDRVAAQDLARDAIERAVIATQHE